MPTNPLMRLKTIMQRKEVILGGGTTVSGLGDSHDSVGRGTKTAENQNSNAVIGKF